MDLRNGTLSGDTVTFLEVFDFQNEIAIRYPAPSSGTKSSSPAGGGYCHRKLVARREPSAAASQSPVGRWKGEFRSPSATRPPLWFSIQNGSLQAQAVAEAREQKDVRFLDVKFAGETLTFAEIRKIQDNG